MDEDIAKTLGELERKLRDLEQVLGSMGAASVAGAPSHAQAGIADHPTGDTSGGPLPPGAPPAPQAQETATHPPGDGRLVDEALERPHAPQQPLSPPAGQASRESPAATPPRAAPAPGVAPDIEMPGKPSASVAGAETAEASVSALWQSRSMRRRWTRSKHAAPAF